MRLPVRLQERTMLEIVRRINWTKVQWRKPAYSTNRQARAKMSKGGCCRAT